MLLHSLLRPSFFVELNRTRRAGQPLLFGGRHSPLVLPYIYVWFFVDCPLPSLVLLLARTHVHLVRLNTAAIVLQAITFQAVTAASLVNRSFGAPFRSTSFPNRIAALLKVSLALWRRVDSWRKTLMQQNWLVKEFLVIESLSAWLLWERGVYVLGCVADVLFVIG